MALKDAENIDLRDSIKKLLEDTEFVKKVINAQNAKEAIEVFKSGGVTITLDELAAVYDLIDQVLSFGENSKLDEGKLENVSGGSVTIAVAAAVALLGGTGLTFRVGRRISNKKADYRDLQAQGKKMEATAHNIHSGKEAIMHEIDSNITMGVEAASVSAALLMLNYYKDDIKKYWRPKKKKMKESIELSRG